MDKNINSAFMIDIDMPTWWKVIQIIGWLEIAIFFILLPFERKHEYIYKMGKIMPNNPLCILVIVLIGTPILWAGILACIAYLVFVFFLWVVAK
jgi:hypothetical protein